jgi:hypothetical protein
MPMTATISDIVRELETLPDRDREEAARYVHQLAAARRERRRVMLRETGGSLRGEAGEALEQAIAECSRIEDEH